MCGLREVVNLCTTHSNLHNPFHFFYLPTYSPCPSRLAHPLLNPQVISPPYHHRHEHTRMYSRGVILVAYECLLSPSNETNIPPPSSSQEESTPQWSRQGAAENKPLSIEEEEGACREGRWYPPPSSSCLFLSLFFSPHCFPFLFFSLVSFLSFLSFVYTSNSTPPPLSLYH